MGNGPIPGLQNGFLSQKCQKSQLEVLEVSKKSKEQGLQILASNTSTNCHPTEKVHYASYIEGHQIIQL